MEHCIRIKQLENEADVVYHEAIASLFAEQLPPIEVIKWKDIYDNMERVHRLVRRASRTCSRASSSSTPDGVRRSLRP